MAVVAIGGKRIDGDQEKVVDEERSVKTRKVVKAIVVLTSVGVGVVIALFSCVTELLLPQYSVNNDIEVLAKEVAEIPLFVLSVASIFCFRRACRRTGSA